MKVRFIKITNERNGEGANGPWCFIQFLVETIGEKTERQIAFDCGTDVASKIKGMNTGDVFNLEYSLFTNEYKGKYYTTPRVYKIVLEAGDPPVSSYTAPVSNATQTPEDDLPF